MGQRVIILHGFVKKSERTLAGDLEIARRRMEAVGNG